MRASLVLLMLAVFFWVSPLSGKPRLSERTSRLTLSLSSAKGKLGHSQLVEAYTALVHRLVYLDSPEVVVSSKGSRIYLDIPAGTDLDHLEKVMLTQSRVDLRLKTEQGWRATGCKLWSASVGRDVDDHWSLKIGVDPGSVRSLLKLAPQPDSGLGLFVDDQLYAQCTRGGDFASDPNKELSFDGLGPLQRGRQPAPDESGYRPPSELQGIAASIRFPLPSGLTLQFVPLQTQGQSSFFEKI